MVSLGTNLGSQGWVILLGSTAAGCTLSVAIFISPFSHCQKWLCLHLKFWQQSSRSSGTTERQPTTKTKLTEVTANHYIPVCLCVCCGTKWPKLNWCTPSQSNTAQLHQLYLRNWQSLAQWWLHGYGSWLWTAQPKQLQHTSLHWAGKRWTVSCRHV